MSSKRPVAPEGYTPASMQLALRGDGNAPGGNTRLSLILGLVWCTLGGAFVSMAPVLANVLVAFGQVAVMARGGRREQALALLCPLAAGCATAFVLFGVEDLPMAVVSVLCAFVLAWGMTKGRLTTGLVIMVAVVTTCVMLATDTVATSLQGTSVGAQVAAVVNDAVEANLASLDLSGTAALLETRDSLLVLWPAIYFSVGVGIVLCSLAGAWISARTGGVAVRPGMIAHYDVPLWVAVAFAAGVVVELLGPRLPAWQDEATMVGANVVLCARIVLAQQGLSVLQWWARERRVAPPIAALVVVMAVWLEMSFALASVLGLVDVAVNFRHLERRRADLVLGPGRER